MVLLACLSCSFSFAGEFSAAGNVGVDDGRFSGKSAFSEHSFLEISVVLWILEQFPIG